MRKESAGTEEKTAPEAATEGSIELAPQLFWFDRLSDQLANEFFI